MYYRIRPSSRNYSNQELVVVVGPRNEEQAADPKIRKFIVEFVEFGCRYVFIASNGVGQWYYEAMNAEGEGGQGIPLTATMKTISHPFYSEDLVQVTAGLHKSLMILLLGGGKIADWTFCHQPKSHYHQILKVYWNLELYSEELGKIWGAQGHPEIGCTTHVVCGSARLVDIFDALCGEKVKDKDELFLTDIPTYYDLVRYNYMRKAGTDRPMLRMVVGKSYSYFQGRVEQLWLCDLGWKVHVVDSAAWVIPSRRSWLEQSMKQYTATAETLAADKDIKEDKENSVQPPVETQSLLGIQSLRIGN